jgi:hypothetical protein
MHFKVIEGFITSSIEYNSAKEGKATMINITEGITVQMISIAVPCVTKRDV